MPVDSDDTLREILDGDTIAVVGLSSTPGKAAHDIPAYMREQGYEVIPINPYADEIFGREPYDSLAEVEEEVDIVDVFRPTDEVPEIVDEALDRDDAGTVWLQLGITHDDAGERVEAAGRNFVQDRCLKVEHERLSE
ncbi:CoA-binding protein [Halosimplex pelagicum]|uniref:CoA-binding protein n=1 Tax=Halosimplex pelagicum TaxID=869886 RepID=A0A7D5PD54_9EURY|nr:CoA-binding protein [Halosimplex pelagicum]QLH83038.1 CoA-binding protein [Halosimplex pelagicum]